MDKPIWYFSVSGEWWMESGTPQEIAEMLSKRADGLEVTNARKILPAEFLRRLESGKVCRHV